MELLPPLRSNRLVAIVRGSAAGAALRCVLVLADEGVKLIEVSLTTDQALGVIARASAELGQSAALGAGTVLTAQDARNAREAGAAFIVTPGRAYLQAGAVAIGVGSPLIGDAADGGDLDALRRRARTYLRALADGTAAGGAR